MRQITAITMLVGVLLFVSLTSRFLDATVPPPVSRLDKSGSSVDRSTRSASDRLRSGTPPDERTIKAGGIWFW
jgi:hypothetical protein